MHDNYYSHTILTNVHDCAPTSVRALPLNPNCVYVLNRRFVSLEHVFAKLASYLLLHPLQVIECHA